MQTLDDTHYVECRREATRLRTEWTCDARNEVVVDVYLAVRCVMPRV